MRILNVQGDYFSGLRVIRHGLTVCLLLPGFLGSAQSRNLYSLTSGTVSFDSDAPLELIHASTQDVYGIIDVDKNTFGFIIPVAGFEGFNSSLQREHFNENYLESSLYPKAKFYGKIDGEYDLTKVGEYAVTARGVLDIHNVSHDRAIPAALRINPDGSLKITSTFLIRLEDHDIKVPSVVKYKIAEVITTTIEAKFIKRE